MRNSIIHKLRYLLVALFGGLFSIGGLFAMVTEPASLAVTLQVVGWGIAGGVLVWGFQKRLLRSWRYAIVVMIGLVVSLQMALAFLHLPLTPVAHAASIVVNTLADELNSDGDCSLREAITTANTNLAVDNCTQGTVGADVITFNPILANGTIVLSVGPAGDDAALTGDLDIVEAVTITGLGVGTTIIDGGGLDRVFHIVAGATGPVNISALTIQNGDSAGNGGGIFNASTATVTLNNTNIIDNVVSGLGQDGGGIANTGGGQVNVTNSMVANNAVTNTGTLTDTNFANGGGIFNGTTAGSRMDISNSTITGNDAVDNGGGIFNDKIMDISNNTTISNNSSTDGGGIFNTLFNGQLTIAQSTLSGNTTTTNNGDGGGLFNGNSGDVFLSQVTVTNNTAQGQGGGLFNNDTNSTIAIGDSDITNNAATTSDGGGVANVRGAVTITSSTIINNDAGDDGGGVSNDLTGTMAVDDTTISGNTANDNGGGVFSSSSGTVTIDRSTISGNSAPNNRGGGVFSSGPVNINISTISGNVANSGGGLTANMQTAQVSLNGVTIAANTANSGNGGGIFRDAGGGGGSISFRNSLIALNTGSDCTDSGGGAPSPTTLTSQGNNLIGNDTGCTGLVASDITDINPLLGPLANNGHTTQTHALLLGSPAIDGGNNATCNTTDQRGTNRINQPGVGSEASNSCDIGAYEFTAIVAVPSVQISDETIAEGDSGTAAMTFAVSLTGATPAYTVTVDFDTADGTATIVNDDYISTGGTLTFPPGALSTQNITVFVKGDNMPEADEVFYVNLSNLNWATLSDGQGQGTIVNDDLGISISDTSVAEGDEGTVEAVFDVTLSPVQGANISVNYSTDDGTAEVADNDYVAESGLVTFSPGITRQQISITVNGDTNKEADEIFLVNLSNPTGGAGLVGGGSGQGIIINDDNNFSTFLPVIIKN